MPEEPDTASSILPDSISNHETKFAANEVIEVKKKPEITSDKKIGAPEPVKEELPLPVSSEKDELFHYQNSKLISLRITPWKSDRRQLIFYDKKGNITYTQDDVRLSYQEVSEVKEFHSNGAVAKIQIHNNPGASRHWSEILITFDQNNEPEWKTIMTYPLESISQTMNNTYRFDRIQKNWVLEQKQ
ncbi:MAG: hypothetical protein IPP69_14200 [Flavobacteriales bacterium]|nr:hypothetical protein [Flavobacteriales bacterium]